MHTLIDVQGYKGKDSLERRRFALDELLILLHRSFAESRRTDTQCHCLLTAYFLRVDIPNDVEPINEPMHQAFQHHLFHGSLITPVFVQQQPF
jgi:hypothetical protein